MTFADVADRVFRLYGNAEYLEALNLVREASERFPEHENDLIFWKACLLSQTGKSLEALNILADAVNRGQWWPLSQLADTDLDPVRQLPEWDRVEGRCAQISEEKLSHRPGPIQRLVDDPSGTLIVVPGARANQRAFASTWETAIPADWNVITPAASEPTPARGEWQWHRSVADNVESVLNDVHDIRLHRPLVLAGFSIGSAIACSIINNKSLPAIGMIAVAPSSYQGFDELRSVAGSDTRSLIVCGDQDPRSEKYAALRAELDHRSNVTFALVEGLGHENPRDLPQRVGEFLNLFEHIKSQSTPKPD